MDCDFAAVLEVYGQSAAGERLRSEKGLDVQGDYGGFSEASMQQDFAVVVLVCADRAIRQNRVAVVSVRQPKPLYEVGRQRQPASETGIYDRLNGVENAAAVRD